MNNLATSCVLQKEPNKASLYSDLLNPAIDSKCEHNISQGMCIRIWVHAAYVSDILVEHLTITGKRRSFPLTEEEYILRLDDVANTLKCWGAVSHVRSSLEKLKERPRIGKAVSIFIDMDESGGRANEWIYNCVSYSNRSSEADSVHEGCRLFFDILAKLGRLILATRK
ncbi:UNVERIFIED_CONTAM: hypothetical protein Sindi_1496800 [Sesamum indicum]